MRAAVRRQAGAVPKLGNFEAPRLVEGAVLIDVETAGLGAWDVLGAYRLDVEYPCVVRGEGVGRASDGRRVYFGERSISPYGAWAERTVVPIDEVWDVPDDIDDGTAIILGIAGTGAFVPLEQAEIEKGETVLVLGATGALGQVGLQLARHLGAGRVVAAGRDRHAVDRTVERGWADAGVQVGTADDAAALQEAARGGFDVVLDVVYGAPFVAALKATRWGARVMSIGAQAGMTAEVNVGDMLYRTHTCVGTGQLSAAERQGYWERLLDFARTEGITFDSRTWSLDQVAEAWGAQQASPHAKILGTIAG